MGFSLGGFLGISKSKGSSSQESQLTPTEETDLQRSVREQNERVALQQGQGFSDLLSQTGAGVPDGQSAELAAIRAELAKFGTEGQSRLGALESGIGTLTPEQQAHLEAIYGPQAARGREELLRFGNDLAAARGLAISDSPISNPLMRSFADFSSSLGAARAGSALQLGQQGFQNRLGVLDRSLNLGQQGLENRTGLLGFESDLAQRAFANRTALLGGAPGSIGQQTLTDQFRLATGVQRGAGREKQQTVSGGVRGMFGTPGQNLFGG